MRLVRYTDDTDGTTVELHPMLTVICGLEDPARARLLGMLDALPAGRDPGGSGQIEVHGICLDLSGESLELLELETPIDVVLRRGDLPGMDTAADAASDAVSQSAPEAAAETAETPRGLEAAQRDLEDATRRLAVQQRRLTPIESELADLNGEIEAAEASARGARADLDGYAEAGLRVAQEELGQLLSSTSASSSDDPVPLDPRIAAERAEIMGRLDQLIGVAGSMKKQLRRSRRVALESVGDARRGLELATAASEQPLVEAIDLADRLEMSSQRVAALATRRAGGRQRLHEVTRRRDVAYDAYMDATRMLRAPELDPGLVDELELIHDEIFELDGRTGRLGGGKTRRRLLDLRSREATILGRLGFDTWSSYVMGVSSNSVDAERHRRLEVAKATYELAEDELARALEQPVIDDPELVAAEAQHRDLLAAAADLLGAETVPDPLAALRAMRVPTGASHLSVEDAAQALQNELFAVGADVPPRALTPDDLLEIAADWLDVAERTNSELGRLEVDHERVESEISELASRLEELPDEPEIARTPTIDPEALAEAQARVVDAERRARRHHAAEAELTEVLARLSVHRARAEELRGDVDQARADVVEAQAALSDAERKVADLREDVRPRRDPRAGTGSGGEGRVGEAPRPRGRVESHGVIDTEAVEWYVLARLAQQRAVSFVGSVPMGIDDAFSAWSVDELTDVFGRLVRMSEVIQILYLTDDDAIASWARALGPDRAAVVDVRTAEPLSA